MWRVAGLLESDARAQHRKISLFDNSFGCARMFQFADPKLHRLVGIEIDADVADAVQRAAELAGFDRQLMVGSIEQFRRDAGTFDLGIINPPFSITIDDAAVEDFGVNAYGRHSGHSSTVSHRYALAQSLEWCDRTVAVVPRSLADEVLTHDAWSKHRRYHVATLHLPRSAFRSEGAEVDVSILVFGDEHVDEPTIKTLTALDHEPLLEATAGYGQAKLTRVGVDESKPAVTLPVTGDKRVRIAHDGRKVILKFGCAIAQARVLNEVLRERPNDIGKNHRRAARVKYAGQGQLDLENYLAQDKPLSALEDFTARIDALGFESDVEPSLWAWLDRMGKRRELERVPFRHVVYLRDGGFSHWLGAQFEVVGVAKEDHEHHERWCGPTKIAEGQEITFTRSSPPPGDDSNNLWWNFDRQGYGGLRITERALVERFSFPAFDERPNGWTEIQPGLRKTHPERYAAAAKRARAMGLDRWCTWGYQFDDLVEVSLKRGAIVGWEMGLGKARLAVALCYIGGGKHNLISVEPRLVGEIREEFAKLGVPDSDWQVIETVEQARDLRRVNVISYERLKAVVKRPSAKLSAKAVAKEATAQIEEKEAELDRICADVVEAKRAAEEAEDWDEEPGMPEDRILALRTRMVEARTAAREAEARLRAAAIEIRDMKENHAALAKRRDPKRLTFADVLRRRIHTHVADEGHLLRNPKTQQTQAVIKVSAKGHRYLLSGTPIGNYPRDILPLLWWVAGDGICSQVFGQHWPYMQTENLMAVDTAWRGVDVFKDMFITLEWVTNEFADDLRSGAKREVPKIKDVAGFRSAVGHWVKRRLKEEPDVAKHVKFPVPTYHDHAVPWDRDHLAFYVATAKEFVAWFTNLPEYQRRGAGLIAILAKIRAVLDAANYPQGGVRGRPKFTGGPTSKQRKALDLLARWTKQGHKSIMLCESPAVVDWFEDELARLDIEGVPFHGGIPIAKRVDQGLDKRFRYGDAPVLLATKGSLQTGYNIAQACRVLHFDRSWTPTVERQADARVLRPQQTKAVEIHRLGLPGSIDAYQAQMVAAKWNSMAAGLDYGEDDDEFVFEHLETIMGRFVEDFEAKRGPLFAK